MNETKWQFRRRWNLNTKTEADLFLLRKQMLEDISLHSGGKEIDSRVLSAMDCIPRHKFIEQSPKSIECLPIDYADRARPIGFGQTISQPFVVAYMTDKLDVKESHRVLEIGTGSGYQAAVLSQLCSKVFTVERIEPLLRKTLPILSEYTNVVGKLGDGHDGWQENAPYDRIMVTAMTDTIPLKLFNQLEVSGKMILPLSGMASTSSGNLVLLTKTKASYKEERLIGVNFVPLVGGISARLKPINE
jgi:protein-L-isoaspartate(D-aspartate) O-methyltransferase